MFLILVSSRFVRLSYILNVCIKTHWGDEWEMTSDVAAFAQSKDRLRLNLSDKPIEGLPFLPACGLVTTYNNIAPVNVDVCWIHDLPAAFFYPTNTAADLPFDVWSWLFYLLSRYEEYLPFEADTHGRFAAAQSLAFKHQFLHLPVVDDWIKKLQNIVQHYYPQWKPEARKPVFLPTYDIDYAYAYLAKGFWRQLASLLRTMAKLDFAALRFQWSVLRGNEKDPYDTFDYITHLSQMRGLPARFFWLVGKYGKYDKNCLLSHAGFRKLIYSHAQEQPIGWHPSYRSNDEDLSYARAEKQRLEEAAGIDIRHSRQHFLRLSFPQTYQRLLQLGIRHEYSMGYADALGFRASTALPFVWYDLSAEQETELRIYPFAVMEVTLKNYLHYSPEQAIEKAKPIVENALSAGFFSMIWHNNSLCEREGWQGWRSVLEALMQ